MKFQVNLRRGDRKVLRDRDMTACIKIAFSKCDRATIYLSSQKLGLHALDLHRSKLARVLAYMEKGLTASQPYGILKADVCDRESVWWIQPVVGNLYFSRWFNTHT